MYLEDVKKCADSLLRILNDVLDFSKIEAGKLEFEVIEFDPRETVEEMLKVLGVHFTSRCASVWRRLAGDKVAGERRPVRRAVCSSCGREQHEPEYS